VGGRGLAGTAGSLGVVVGAVGVGVRVRGGIRVGVGVRVRIRIRVRVRVGTGVRIRIRIRVRVCICIDIRVAVGGRIGVGVMVRDGAPVPRIATVEEFKQALLNSRSIVFNQASTGLYIDSLFKRLGIAAETEAKITRYADFVAVRDHVSNGRGSEIAFGATTVIIENASKGLRFVGPLPADTLFVPSRLAAADCVLAMYHDQGLPVLKYASFGKGINVTLGLPLIRTSVDHGTALELAGSGGADPESLFVAVEGAIGMARAGASVPR